jgi:hypothetical protein
MSPINQLITCISLAAVKCFFIFSSSLDVIQFVKKAYVDGSVPSLTDLDDKANSDKFDVS